jgi:hypothetical protein
VTTPDEQTPQERDPLQLSRCPDCGYPLTGLRPTGLCPECGFTYTQDTIVLYVWPPGTGPGERQWWLLGPLLCLSVLQLARLMWENPARFFLPGDLLGVVILIGAIAPAIVMIGMLWLWFLWGRTWIRARRDNPPAPVQVRLTPQGYAVRYGFGRVKIKPWAAVHRLRLEPIPGGRCSIVIENSGVPIWEYTGGCQVDCDADEADRIRRRVNDWCSQTPR